MISSGVMVVQMAAPDLSCAITLATAYMWAVAASRPAWVSFATAGLVAGGGEPAAVLAREWAAGERADFAWLMTSSGIAWPGDV